MIPTVVVDTNVLSFLFKRDTRADLYRPHLDGKLAIISFMTLAEVDRWALQRNWGDERKRGMEQFLAGFVPVFCDRSLCLKWAEASDRARRNGRLIDSADAWIAATALVYGVSLVTHNPRHFVGVDGLTLVSESRP